MVAIVKAEADGRVARPLKELAVLIKEDLANAKKAEETASLPYYRAAGEKLIEAKGRLKHGEFTSWVKLNFSVSPQRARKYMSFVVAIQSMDNERAGSFSSLNDYHRQTGDSQWHPNRSVNKRPWHDDVKSGIERAREEAKRLHDETLTRQQERVAERKLALKLIDIGYRILSKELHPDKGGTRDAMSRLSRVRDRLKQHA